MKTLNEKLLCGRLSIAASAAAVLSTIACASGEFDTVVDPIVSFIESLTAPLLAIVVAVGTLYCILLGIKYAKAEEPQDREKAKTHLKNAVIGFVLIFVLIFALHKLTPIMVNWVNKNAETTVIAG